MEEIKKILEENCFLDCGHIESQTSKTKLTDKDSNYFILRPALLAQDEYSFVKDIKVDGKNMALNGFYWLIAVIDDCKDKKAAIGQLSECLCSSFPANITPISATENSYLIRQELLDDEDNYHSKLNLIRITFRYIENVTCLDLCKNGCCPC